MTCYSVPSQFSPGPTSLQCSRFLRAPTLSSLHSSSFTPSRPSTSRTPRPFLAVLNFGPALSQLPSAKDCRPLDRCNIYRVVGHHPEFSLIAAFSNRGEFPGCPRVAASMIRGSTGFMVIPVGILITPVGVRNRLSPLNYMPMPCSCVPYLTLDLNPGVDAIKASRTVYRCVCVVGREEAQSKLQALKERGRADVQLHSQEMRELQRQLDHDSRLQVFLSVKGQTRVMADLEERERQRRHRQNSPDTDDNFSSANQEHGHDDKIAAPTARQKWILFPPSSGVGPLPFQFVPEVFGGTEVGTLSCPVHSWNPVAYKPLLNRPCFGAVSITMLKHAVVISEQAFYPNSVFPTTESQKEAQEQMITTYQEILRQIKECCNETDVEKLSAHYAKQEEENFTIFNYVNELNNEANGKCRNADLVLVHLRAFYTSSSFFGYTELPLRPTCLPQRTAAVGHYEQMLELLQEQAGELQRKIDVHRAESRERASQHQDSLDQLQRELEASQRDTEASRQATAAADKLLSQVLRSVENIFNLVRCDNAPVLQLLGNVSSGCDYDWWSTPGEAGPGSFQGGEGGCMCFSDALRGESSKRLTWPLWHKMLWSGQKGKELSNYPEGSNAQGRGRLSCCPKGSKTRGGARKGFCDHFNYCVPLAAFIYPGGMLGSIGWPELLHPQKISLEGMKAGWSHDSGGMQVVAQGWCTPVHVTGKRVMEGVTATPTAPSRGHVEAAMV
ncbi:hypothetical protein PR048_002828 [Dryococelus australis]|uniref:ODAD1 central coiled coil region domain-containing protein n=1 Tax=Dryococelus australis TaxID=614101 RepID=A0ABQ9ILA9_9NEOP|nr:hypothetical protein PR048_002828 [Dryococelus australis]